MGTDRRTQWVVALVAALVLGACSSGGGKKDGAALAANGGGSTTTIADTTTSAAAESTTITAATAPPTTAAARAAAVVTTQRPPATQPPATAAPATSPPATQPPQITIQGFAFMPQTLNIAAGTKVTVTNNDTTVHTWTADGMAPQWNSGDLAPTMSYSHVFASPGTFAYHCAKHSSMTGTVHVS